ncbi:hypothetical protein CRYUN_Cryun28dG0058100 [Craigia yunnanensis]
MASCSGLGLAMACLVLVLSCMVSPALQYAVFTVGEDIGWIPGVDYNAWAKAKNIKDNSGSATIALLTAGPHYFMCGVVGHCAQGMKLLVNVMAEPTTLPSATLAASSSPPASN